MGLSLRHIKVNFLFSVVALLLLCPSAIRAQVAGGSILGTVSDRSGAVIAGAAVQVTNTQTGVSHIATTDTNGSYSAVNLLPGPYRVSISSRGFKTLVQAGLVITVGGDQTLNATLQVGSTDQTIIVQTLEPAVDVNSSTLSAVVDAKTITTLPLNGRSWTDLATLQPGVAAVRSEQVVASRAQHGYGTELTISGSRPQQNNYRVNGISINDYSNGAPGSVVGVALGVDAIQEFSVLTSNYTAAYGRTSGGVINAVTRNGTNQLHGSAYEFARNSALDARNYFDGPSIPAFTRNQFGASLGGPIVKDRLFLFGDYEGLRQSLGFTQSNIVPSNNARTGNLAAGSVVVDPQAARYLAAFYPTSTALLGNGDTASYPVAGQEVTPENYFTTRADYNMSPKDVLDAVYFYDTADTAQPDEFNAKTTSLISGSQALMLEEGHTFNSSIVSAARFGFSRSRGASGSVSNITNPAMNDLSYGFAPGETVGSIVITGVTSFTGGANGSGLPQFRAVQNSFQGYDDFFYKKGKHSITLGAAFERLQVNSYVTSWTGAQISFSSLANFLTNKPLSITAVLNPLTLATERGTRQSIIAGYVQDDWRITPRLTVNLGLRYEMSTVPTEVHGKIATLINITDAMPHTGDPYFQNPTLKNWEPKLGFAWDPFGTGKTSVRSAFGFFDVLPLPYLFEILTPYSAPFFQQANSSSLPAGSFPTGAYQAVAANPQSLRVSYVDPHPKRNYVTTWNLNIQQQLSNTTSFTVAYIGSRGVHQPWTNNDANMVIPTMTSQGYTWPSPATSSKVNPNWGRIALKLWQADSFYNGLQLGVRKDLSKGLQFQASYSWAKSIDNSSSSEADNAFQNSIGNPYWFAPRTNRGVSDFDLRNSLVLSAIWNLPLTADQNPAPVRAMFGGWQLGGIYTASSGSPFNVFLSGDPLGTKGNSPSELPSRAPGCNHLTTGNPKGYVNTACFVFPNPINVPGNIGRNALTGPGLSELDFSLSKTGSFALRSREIGAVFRFDAFNIPNHSNFAAPNTNDTIFTSAGSLVSTVGLCNLTQTTSRQLQFSVKLTF